MTLRLGTLTVPGLVPELGPELELEPVHEPALPPTVRQAKWIAEQSTAACPGADPPN